MTGYALRAVPRMSADMKGLALLLATIASPAAAMPVDTKARLVRDN